MKKFTKIEIDTAVKVLSNSHIVKNWAKNMAKAFGVDITTDRGKSWYEKKCEEVARNLLR